MNRWTHLVFLALVACGGETPAPEPTPEPEPEEVVETSPVEKAALIAKAIDADPDGADKALEEHGMTESEYRDLLYEIAEDAAKSEAFLAARGG